jgi:hypothetical protein
MPLDQRIERSPQRFVGDAIIHLETHDLVPVIGIGQVEFNKPSLDRCQRNRSDNRLTIWFGLSRTFRYGCEFGDRRPSEYHIRRDLQSGLTGFRGNADALNRVAAEVKEVVVDSDLPHAQNVGPDGRKLFLSLVSRRSIGHALGRALVPIEQRFEEFALLGRETPNAFFETGHFL